LILCARPLVSRIFSPGFADAALFVPFLAVSALFSALSSFLGSVYVVKLRSGASLTTAAVGVAVNLLLDIWWIPRLGTVGAVAATLFSYLAVFLWRAVHCKRVMPFALRVEKLTVATLLLLVTAALTVRGAWWWGIPTAVLSVLPFAHELLDSALTLLVYGKKILQKTTKKQKSS